MQPKIDIEKAILLLLKSLYYSEFIVVDGVNQHQEGLSFEEWLKDMKLIK